MNQNNEVNIKVVIDGKEGLATVKFTDEMISKLRANAGNPMRPVIDDSIAQMKISELKNLHNQLKNELQEKIKLDVDIKTLEPTREKIAQVEQALAGLQQQASRPTGSMGDNIIAMNQFLELAKKGYDAVKMIISPVIDLAAQYENAQTSFEVLLGSAERADKMVGDLKEKANKSPLEFTDFQKGAETLLNFGIAGNEVIPTLDLLANVAGANSQKMEQLTLVMGQVASASKLQGQDLLQLVNAGFNPLQEIARTTHRSMGDLRKEMEAGKVSYDMVVDAFKSATGEGGRFNGMMEKQSQTFTGLISTMKDSLGQLGTSIGNTLLPVLKPLVSQLTAFTNSLNGVKSEMDQVRDKAIDQQSKFETLVYTYDSLAQKTNKSAEETKLLKETIGKLNTEYSNYFSNIDLEKGKYDDVQIAISKARTELEKYLNAMIMQKIVEQMGNDLDELTGKLYRATKTNIELKKSIEDSKQLREKDGQLTVKSGADFGDPNKNTNSAMTSNLIKINENSIKQLNEQKNKIVQTQVEIKNELSKLGFIAPNDDNKIPKKPTNSDDDKEKLKGLNEYQKAKEAITKRDEELDNEATSNQINNIGLVNKAIEESKNKELSIAEEINIAEKAKNKKKVEELQNNLKVQMDNTKQLYNRKDELEKQDLENQKKINDEKTKDLEKSLKEDLKLIEDYYKAKSDFEKEFAKSNTKDIEREYAKELKESPDSKVNLLTPWKKDENLTDKERNLNAEKLEIQKNSSKAINAEQMKEYVQQMQIWNRKKELLEAEKKARKDLTQQTIQNYAMQYSTEQSVGKQMLQAARENIKAGIMAKISGAIVDEIAWVMEIVPWPLNLAVAPAAGIATGALFEAIVPKFADGKKIDISDYDDQTHRVLSGQISGKGTGRSDSILARVANGEFIINAESTAKYAPLLEAINNNRFADGGYVGSRNIYSYNYSNTASSANYNDNSGVINELRTLKDSIANMKVRAFFDNKAARDIDRYNDIQNRKSGLG